MVESGHNTQNRWRTAVLGALSAAILYAPLAFGGTTPTTALGLAGILTVSFLLWAVLLCVERRRPMLGSTACLIALAVLVFIGVSHVLNPKFTFQSEPWAFVAVPDAMAWLPGTVDVEATRAVMGPLLAFLLAFVVLLDLMSSSVFRWRLFRAIALSGFVISLVGLTQKAGGADSMLWTTPERSGDVFFAAFRYHANSAAFLNLCWPASLALWLRNRQEGSGAGLAKSFWLVTLFFILLAVFVNSSKAGQILGLVGLTYAVFRYRSLFVSRDTSRAVLAISLVLGIGVFVISILPSVATTVDQWDNLVADGGSLQGRLLAYGAALQVLPDSGWFGTGPGTFRLVFPFYTVQLGDQISGIWYHAHQDYLQTLIEWGFVGGVAWGVLILGGLGRAVVRVRMAQREGQIEYSASCSILAMLLVLLHALVDFPFQIPAIQVLIMIYVAVFWSLNLKRYDYKKTGARK